MGSPPLENQSKEAAERQTPQDGAPRLGMLIAQNSDAYAHLVMRAVANAAQERGVDICSVWFSDYGALGMGKVEFLRSQGCKAVMIPWFAPLEVKALLAFAKRSPVPVAHPQTNFSESENNISIERGRMVVQSLCEYVRYGTADTLAYLGPDQPANVLLQQRLDAFSSFCSERGIPYLTGSVTESVAAMNEVAKRWAALQGHLAVLAYDDDHALRLMTAMRQCGLSAPRDYRVVGFNNTPGCRFADPPLTTVAQNFDFIANQLIRNALDLAAGKEAHYYEVGDLHLLVRETCRGREFLRDHPALYFPGLAWRIEPKTRSEITNLPPVHARSHSG